MINIIDLRKSYSTKSGINLVLDSVNFKIDKSEQVGILGRNGAGKSTLIRLISGAELPTSGSIIRKMSISWPLAFSGAFQGSLTGIDNVKFIARIYGADIQKTINYVDEFSELGFHLREPVKRYSSGMRARLAFGVSLAVDFDCYLIDEITAVGDMRFQEKCHNELFVKRDHKAKIMVSHNSDFIRTYCSKVGVLNQGKMNVFESVDEGIDFYNSLSF